MQQETLINYINDFSKNKPIFIEEIKTNFNKCEYSKIYVYINSLIKDGILNHFADGIYYKGVITKQQVIEKKYLKNNDKIIGYLTGNSLLYELNIIKSKPEFVDLISNICYKGSRYKNNTLGVIVHKPRTKVNNENYKYLQLFDLIKLNVPKYLVFKYIKDNKLELEKISEYAILTKNKKVLERFLVTNN